MPAMVDASTSLFEEAQATQVGDTDDADAALLEGEAADPEGEHAHAVDHEVRHHDVHGALGPAEAGLHHGEACLHEHDQVAGDQRPDDVDRQPVLVHVAGQVVGERLFVLGAAMSLSESAAAADGDTGEVLWGTNGDARGVRFRSGRGWSSCR